MQVSSSRGSFQIGKKTYTLYQSEVELDSIDPLALLSQSDLFPKIYWEHKEDEVELAGFGALLEFDTLPEIKSLEAAFFEPSLFGGLPFTSQKNSSTPFSQTYFVLPKYLLEKKVNCFILKAFSLDSPPSFEGFNWSAVLPLKSSSPEVEGRTDTPSQSLWDQWVPSALDSFASSSLTKVVLSRRSEFALSDSLNPYALLQALKETQENCSFFSFQKDPKNTFLGATPECLFTRKNRILSTEAIAGTSFGNHALLSEEESLTNTKNFSEFTHVTDFLNKRLEQICTQIQPGKAHEISTGYLRHNYSQFSGQLKEGVRDLEIVRLLHPTPAVCGAPQEEALKKIEEVEGHHRGWYAAPIGHISETKSQFLVGIRSALLQERKITLFAGCGLVQGSCPEKEWEELEAKINAYTQFLSPYVCS